MNEAGVSQRVGVATLAVYFLFAMGCYCMMGGYQTARQQVNRTTAFVSKDKDQEQQQQQVTIPTPEEEMPSSSTKEVLMDVVLADEEHVVVKAKYDGDIDDCCSCTKETDEIDREIDDSIRV